MNPQNGRREYCAKYIQRIQSAWAESHACTLYWNIVYWRDFLTIPTGSAECVLYLAQYPCLPLLQAHLYTTPSSMGAPMVVILYFILCLGDTGGVPVLLSPGIHSFPFKLGLPLGLPSTFLGRSTHSWVGYPIPGYVPTSPHFWVGHLIPGQVLPHFLVTRFLNKSLPTFLGRSPHSRVCPHIPG